MSTQGALAIRVEFLKTRARANRFNEQLQLVQADKGRTLLSLKKEAEVWQERGARNGAMGDEALRQGLSAYAARQADLRLGLCSKFEKMWQSLRNTADTIGDDVGAEVEHEGLRIVHLVEDSDSDDERTAADDLDDD